MNTESKKELRERIAYLEKQNEKLQTEAEAERRAAWEKQIPTAAAVARKEIDRNFPRMVCDFHFDHVDGGGFWFSFELINDDRRQVYAVRHSEII